MHLGWVPNYVSVDGNECAGELAKRDVNMPFLGTETFYDIS